MRGGRLLAGALRWRNRHFVVRGGGAVEYQARSIIAAWWTCESQRSIRTAPPTAEVSITDVALDGCHVHTILRVGMLTVGVSVACNHQPTRHLVTRSQSMRHVLATSAALVF